VERTANCLCFRPTRRAGETSTSRRLFPNYEFVSLDLPTEAEQVEKEAQTLLERNLPR
jgi:uncharacterized protein